MKRLGIVISVLVLAACGSSKLASASPEPERVWSTRFGAWGIPYPADTALASELAEDCWNLHRGRLEWVTLDGGKVLCILAP